MSLLLAYDITEESVTIIDQNGVPRSAHQSHPNYEKIRTALLGGDADADQMIMLVDAKVRIEGQAFGLVTVGSDAIWYKEQQIQGYLVDKLLAMLGDGVDIGPWAELLNNLMLNPEPRAQERLPLFLTKNGLPLTKDGHFLAWRLVKADYWDIHTGNTFLNEPGKIIEMAREDCDSDPDQTCSRGIHVCAFDYLSSYGFSSNGNRCMLVKVNPADVISVPTDYGNAKMRTCKIEVLREVPAELVPALFNRVALHVTSEHGYIEEEDDYDSYDDEDGDDNLMELEETVVSPPLVFSEGDLLVMGETHPIPKPRKTKKKGSGSTNAARFYLAGEAGEWLAIRRSTGKVQKTFESRSEARDHVRKLNG